MEIVTSSHDICQMKYAQRIHELTSFTTGNCSNPFHVDEVGRYMLYASTIRAIAKWHIIIEEHYYEWEQK